MQREQNKVLFDEFVRQVESMVEVCFEGQIRRAENAVCLTLPSGQKYRLTVSEE